jgi:hypothetical protein
MRPAPGAAHGAGPTRIICKPKKDLKPVELTADMMPVGFAYWVDAFEAYHAGSHTEVATGKSTGLFMLQIGRHEI